MNNLQLKQRRYMFSEKATISDVNIDGKFICYLLEDRDRGLLQSMSLAEVKKIKVDGETCIAYGTYEIDITLSARFGYWLPLLLNTLAFGGIRQHTGNTDLDTEGCQLPGTTRGVDRVSDSTGAFYKLLFIYCNHLTLNAVVAQQLVELHKKKKAGAKEFGELLTKSRVAGQKIFITITK